MTRGSLAECSGFDGSSVFQTGGFGGKGDEMTLDRAENIGSDGVVCKTADHCGIAASVRVQAGQTDFLVFLPKRRSSRKGFRISQTNSASVPRIRVSR